MKQIIWILSLLTFMGCQKKSPVEPAKFKTIMIKSFGEVETLPNMATFHINLNCLDKSVKNSKKCLVDKSNELLDKLKTFGIDKDDILTTSVEMHKSYTWRNRSRSFKGYQSSTTVFITVRVIDKLDDIYTELLENSNLDLSGLSYSHSAIDSLKTEAYVNALEKSGTLSDRLLDQIPETNKEILKIGNIEITASLPQVNQSEYDFVEQEIEVMMDSENKKIAISKGTVKVTATLYVEYQIN